MSSRPRPRSASLKALPPDSPTEVASLSAGWSSKEKGQKRPLKSVSLKLKGDGSPSTSSGAWGSGELLIDARQCLKAQVAGPARGEAPPAPRNTPQSGRIDGRPTEPVPGRPPIPKAVEASVAASSYPSVPDEEARPSSSSYRRAAAIYAALPKTPGGTRTLVRDADGFIFRPSVEVEAKPVPKPRLRPQSRGLNDLVASLSKKPQKPKEAAPKPAEVEEDAPRPRIAWSEGSPEDVFLDAADMAAQIRRDWLAQQLSEALSSSAEKAELRTEDGRRSQGELEASLAKARERAERNRQELNGYLDTLRNKTFQVDDEEEPLISLPPDFEDVVDINASLTASERRRSKEPGAALDAGFRLPAFLEKYFYEEKAVELPIVQFQRQETDLDKVARQVAKLDALLSRREADGLARLQAAKDELAARKERLRRESEQTEAEKIELLRKLKEKGLLRSQPSGSRVVSAAPSSSNSPRQSAEPSEVDWSSWECSESSETPTPAPVPSKETKWSQEGAESTFLTSSSGDLAGLGKKRGSARPLEPVAEDPPMDETSEGPELAPIPLLEELLKEPYDLEALHAIDQKLAKMIPESEWEAKSISLHEGSQVSGGGKTKTSVLSHFTSSSLPGEPVLREQMEEREARKALVAINDQLGRLQEQRQSELRPEQLQRLLMEAAASQSAVDAASKVQSLTQGELESLMLRPVVLPDPEDGPFAQAKQLLSRLAVSSEEWDSTNTEVRCSFVEFEDSVRALEESASRPATAAREEDPLVEDLVENVSHWAAQLEALSREADLLAEQGMPQADAAASSADPGVDLELPEAPEGVEDLQLPMLRAAEEELSDVASLSSDDSPVFLPVKEAEVEKAIDLELPSEGRWSDEDLERFSRAMDEHFGRLAK